MGSDRYELQAFSGRKVAICDDLFDAALVCYQLPPSLPKTFTCHPNSQTSIFQVAERALFLWNNDQIVNLIAHNRHVILPIIFPAVESNTQNHWNHAVQNLSLNVRRMFSEMDDVLFLACHSHYKEEQEKIDLESEKRKEAWEQLEIAASLRPPVAGNIAVLVTPLATSITC